MARTLLDPAMMHADALLVRARQGDRQAQGKLMQLWYKRIYNFGFKFFFDHDLAMEVTQKTFISMHRNLPHLQDSTRFKSWLYAIAINACREELRKRQARRVMAMPDGEEGGPVMQVEAAHRHENPERQFRQAELSDLLQQCLLALSEEQRTVVIMKEFEGFKFREIADALHISENTAKSRLYYGLNALKKILIQRNITKETVGYENEAG